MTKRTSTAAKQRLEKLAWVLDSAIPVPGLKMRVGLDGLLGLVPVAGDTLTTLLSAYIIAEGVRVRAPTSVLLRMGVNSAIDLLIGLIPFFGDIFDFAWKSNRKNVLLLADYLDQPVAVRRGSRWRLVLIAALLVAALFGLLWLVAWLLGAVWTALFG